MAVKQSLIKQNLNYHYPSTTIVKNWKNKAIKTAIQTKFYNVLTTANQILLVFVNIHTNYEVKTD